MRFSLRENMQGVRAHFLLRIANWVSTAPYTFIHTFIVSQICKKVQEERTMCRFLWNKVSSTGQAQAKHRLSEQGERAGRSSTSRAQVKHRSSTGRAQVAQFKKS